MNWVTRAKPSRDHGQIGRSSLCQMYFVTRRKELVIIIPGCCEWFSIQLLHFVRSSTSSIVRDVIFSKIGHSFLWVSKRSCSVESYNEIPSAHIVSIFCLYSRQADA
ncbi:hypothetical protein K1T71_005455 [Dendrolimus kikuchii]|uniref:Uncharacterized protein n=1 Tax=Dendrolimus kikuchii TaxID=765133 RepID=A0ACC1D486_9NEOP|nr:hypothetical protein K1T71_005455 [Dendrolimus kikuchii]